MDALSVLLVGYPLAPVSRGSAGGAEQILAALDEALVEAGHRSLVVAQEGSTVAGTLVPVRRPRGDFDEAAKRGARRDTAAAIVATLAREDVDVVHCHGVDFDSYLPPAGPPLLATLHLPPGFYGDAALRPVRPDTWLHCVSASQHAACPPLPNLLEPIPNGIPVEAFAARHARRRLALVLGRICPEKGVHLAIAAARRAGLPLLIAGALYPYAEHRRYFEEEVRPHLGPCCRWLGPVGFARKRRLLSAAQCLLLPSCAAETSSLVVREAAACGTPAVAFRVGAVPEAIEHGRTGFLVEGMEAMAEAARAAATLDPEICRAHARAHFSDKAMIARYLALYARLADPARRGARP